MDGEFKLAHDFYRATSESAHDHGDGRQLTDPAAILAFMTAGRAVFTLVSKTSGERRTFRIAAPKDSQPGDALRFISLLTGPNNDSDYQYVGLITRSGTELVTRASRGKEPTQPLNAIAWLLRQLQHATAGAPNALDKVEFWHEGRCCRCGRRLTVPASIDSGIGPECATKMN